MTKTNRHERSFSTEEAADLLGLSPSRTRALITEGRIAGHKDASGGWRVYYTEMAEAVLKKVLKTL